MGTAEGLGAGARARLGWMLTAVTAALAALVLAKAIAPVMAEALDPDEAAVTGVVFDDANGNGTRDEGEDGVSGVSVSDGVTVVETGADGRYSLEIDIARRTTDIVFITKPAGWAVPKDEFDAWVSQAQEEFARADGFQVADRQAQN